MIQALGRRRHARRRPVLRRARAAARPALAAVLFAAFVGPAILVMPLWLRVGRRLGKRSGLLIAPRRCSSWRPQGSPPAAPTAPAWWSRWSCWSGVGYAGMQMFPLSMLPDAIAADEARVGPAPRRGLHRRLDRGGDPRARRRPRAARRPARGGRLRLGRLRGPPAGIRAHRRPARLQRRPGAARAGQPAGARPLPARSRGPRSVSELARRRMNRHRRTCCRADRAAGRRRPDARRGDHGLRLRLRARRHR